MGTLQRDRPGVPVMVYLASTEVFCAKKNPTAKVPNLDSTNLAQAAVVACLGPLLMAAIRQVALRPRPRGLDLPPKVWGFPHSGPAKERHGTRKGPFQGSHGRVSCGTVRLRMQALSKNLLQSAKFLR